MEKFRIGFIGLGIMGFPMAEHLLSAGHGLWVHNRSAGRSEALGGRGASVGSCPAEVARHSDFVITMVPDSPDVEAVIAGPQGVMEGVRPGTTVVDMSTASPLLEKRLAERLGRQGCHLIDAPVSGGDLGARNASLSIMAGGDFEAVERARPILEIMGRVTYCGEVGCGQLTKLCNQVLVSLTLLGVSEALTLARKSGLDPRVMVQAVRGGAAGSWQLDHLAPRIIEGDFEPGFKIDLMNKDLRLVGEAAKAASAVLPGTALTRELFRTLEESGREGTQALFKAVEKLSEGPADPQAEARGPESRS